LILLITKLVPNGRLLYLGRNRRMGHKSLILLRRLFYGSLFFHLFVFIIKNFFAIFLFLWLSNVSSNNFSFPLFVFSYYSELFCFFYWVLLFLLSLLSHWLLCLFIIIDEVVICWFKFLFINALMWRAMFVTVTTLNTILLAQGFFLFLV
jgi:hypothetical protein